MEKILSIKCKQANCIRQGVAVKTLPNGEKILVVKNTKHDGQIHPQEYTAKELQKILS